MPGPTTHRHILVGFDGSPASLAALSWAVEEARIRRRDLRLAHVFSWPVHGEMITPHAVMPDMAGIREEAHDALERQLTATRANAPDLNVDAVLVDDVNPARWLIEQTRHASLVVLGPRGMGGFASLLLGSVSMHVTAHAAGPVVVVPHLPAPSPDADILVGVDASPNSEAAIGYAFEEADARGVGLTAVHTIDLITPYGGYSGLENQIQEADQEERRTLAEALAGWREKHPDVTVRQDLGYGRPAPILVDRGSTAQLLVVGSRGRGGFRGLLLGSTSQAILHHATCPVAVVRPQAGQAR